MAPERIEIHRLRLRVPGLEREQALRLARAVASEMASRLPEGRDRRELGSLRMRLTVPGDGGLSELPRQIARRIMEGLS